MYPGLTFFNGDFGDCAELSAEVVDVGAARYAKLLKVLTDVFFPFAPRSECEEEAACADSFVGHVAGWFGDAAVCPREDEVKQKFIGVDDVVAFENSDCSITVFVFADFDTVFSGEFFKHLNEVLVNPGKAG